MSSQSPERELGVGQVALELDRPAAAPADQVDDLIRIGDSALSELEFSELLEELLVRVRDLLGVDTAAILLLDDETDELVASAAKGIEEEVERGVRIPVGRGFAGRIARERVAIFIADVDHADIMNPILREKGIRSLLGVPLIVEGDLIGVLHVGALKPRIFDTRDLAVLELAAARAAPAIGRARLVDALEREHRNAVTLQRSLLPTRLVAAPGVTVAARYLPAREEVGGDWYDTLELPDGQAGIAIGDVVGHGLHAAALMGQLRTALRAYALVGNGPGRTLELVDRFASSLDEDAMATAAYAVVDVKAGVVRFASAGHPPPVLIPRVGDPTVADIKPAPPLGAFGYKPCREQEFLLVPDTTLLFYTDGLVERRGTALGRGIEELVESVRGAAGPEEACLMAMDRLIPELGPRDDVAVIALRIDPAADVLDIERPAVPSMLAWLRHRFEQWLGLQELDRETAIEVTIAVNEACANAIEHAYPPGRGTVEVHARRTDECIEVSVRDHGRWRPERAEKRGRGLMIMETTMDALDVRTSENDGTEIVMRRALKPA